jgi:four helix bundle protein
MKVTRFEDLIAWQRARDLRKTIYRVSSEGPFSRDFEMRDQIRGASLSVMSNIAEGFERNGIPAFLYFLKIANASCAEVRSLVYAAFDEGYVTDEAREELLQATKRVSQIIQALQKSLATKRGAGHGPRGTGHGARGTGHEARGTGHGARGTGHGARGTTCS